MLNRMMNSLYINWNRLPLQATAEYLVERYGSHRRLDLANVTVVMPGRRAGRRLLELLVEKAAQSRLELIPPQIETLGALPEQLYAPKRPFANEFTQRFAWGEVLRRAVPERLAGLVARPPAADDDAGWWELGDELRRQHGELAGDGLDFIHVAQRVGEIGGLAEQQRWERLAEFQLEYLHLLDTCELWDRQTARLKAIEFGECQLDRDVILCATVDMNQATRKMLDQVSSRSPGRITALVFVGPEPHWKERFDEHGCLRSETWLDLAIPLDMAHVRIVDGPDDQAQAVCDQVTAYDGQYRADEITVGFCDDGLVPRVQRRLEAAGVPTRWGPGRPTRETGPYRLIDAMIHCLEEDRFDAFARLARHPDLQAWLADQGINPAWISDLDRFQMKHLPDRLEGLLTVLERAASKPESDPFARSITAPVNSRIREAGTPADSRSAAGPAATATASPTAAAPRDAASGRFAASADAVSSTHSTPAAHSAHSPGSAALARDQADLAGSPSGTSMATPTDRLSDCVRAVRLLLACLEPFRGERRPIGAWVEPLRACLSQLYGFRDWNRDDPADQAVLAACQSISSSGDELLAVPERLAPHVSAATALKMILSDVAQNPIPPGAGEAAIELLGWLELPLDDAPALIVTSLNEGYVPASVTSDLFLPNAVRDRLGLLNNTRRYARDAYAMWLMLSSGRRIDWIAARRTREGDPLLPSRLLLAVKGPELAERALRFFRHTASSHVADLAQDVAETTRDSAFIVPRPQPLAKPIDRLSVTGFRDYLACPYRFYLRHVLRLNVLHDRVRELDPSGFGSLAHEVFRQFGQSPLIDSFDPLEIDRFVQQTLHTCVEQMFGKHVAPVVLVQIEQLRTRLSAWSQHQADWRSKGWRIAYVEAAPPGRGAILDVDQRPFALSGRIDRIDVHPDGRWAILDYKTSDSGQRPEKTHRKSHEWIDLQLPLYRHLAASILGTPLEQLGTAASGLLSLGYITLPKDADECGYQMAEWDDDAWQQADEVARSVIRRIREEKFWPPTDPPPAFSDDFAPICQDDVFDKDQSWLAETLGDD